MKSIRLSLFLIVLMTWCISCIKDQENLYQPVTASEIHIGVLLPISGSGYSSGLGMLASVELASQDINGYFSTAGRSEKLVLEILDTKTDTAEALKQLKALFQKGIHLVIGPYSSAELAHIKSFADANDMLIISPSSVAVSLAVPGDNIFRFVTSDVIQGKAMSKLLTEDKIKVIVPLVRDDLWGNGLVASAGSEFIKSGGMVQPVVRYDPGTTVFGDVMEELDQKVADELIHHNPNDVAVYMLSFSEGTKILSQAKKYTHLNNVYWYGGSAYAQNAPLLDDTSGALFAYTHGLPCPVFGFDESARNQWMPLSARIQSVIGRVPDIYAFTIYDALWVLQKTWLASGKDPSIETLKKVLNIEAAKYFGVTGNTQLDENGDRAFGNYDFWAVKSDSLGYAWKRVARYNSFLGSLIRQVK